MDVYPFHHRNLLFNVVTHLDLTFKEIREILDYLLYLHLVEYQEGEVRHYLAVDTDALWMFFSEKGK